MNAVNVRMIGLNDNLSNPVLVYYAPLVEEVAPLTSASAPTKRSHRRRSIT